MNGKAMRIFLSKQKMQISEFKQIGFFTANVLMVSEVVD